MAPTDLDIIVETLFTRLLKVRFSSSITPRNLTVETFVMIESRIVMSNGFFMVGDYHTWSFTNVDRKLEPVSISTSSLFTVAWTLLMWQLDAKAVVSSAKWTKRIWFEDLYMLFDIQKRVLCPALTLAEHLMQCLT